MYVGLSHVLTCKYPGVPGDIATYHRLKWSTLVGYIRELNIIYYCMLWLYDIYISVY